LHALPSQHGVPRTCNLVSASGFCCTLSGAGMARLCVIADRNQSFGQPPPFSGSSWPWTGSEMLYRDQPWHDQISDVTYRDQPTCSWVLRLVFSGSESSAPCTLYHSSVMRCCSGWAITNAPVKLLCTTTTHGMTSCKGSHCQLLPLTDLRSVFIYRIQNGNEARYAIVP
jgi:hypothetical protein